MRRSARIAAQQRPAHHSGKGFVNPWPSAQGPRQSARQLLRQWDSERSKVPDDPALRPPVVPVARDALAQPPPKQTLVTWLGHACVLVQHGGLNIITDPALSLRCSASQLVGPKRYTAAPLSAEELMSLVKIDIVLLSHNHYDHLDSGSATALKKSGAKWYTPLGVGSWLRGKGIKNVVELDWWDTVREDAAEVVCTPAQHFSGRGLFDRNKTLWSSWLFKFDDGFSFFFGGDTGLRTVPPGATREEEDKLPICPAFREIQERQGAPDLALIPIGAFSPRPFMSRVHLSPADAVIVHKELGARLSMGIHWGTWTLTDEAVMDPPRLLKEELERAGLREDEFVPFAHGESRTVVNDVEAGKLGFEALANDK